MPEIIPTIYKEKLDKASSYLLKYSDIERCFSGRSSTDLYLDVHFNRHQHMWKEDRDRQQAAGQFTIVHCYYFPHASSFFQHESRADKKNPYVITFIYSIPKSVITTLPLNRAVARHVFAEQIEQITTQDLPRIEWRVIFDSLGFEASRRSQTKFRHFS